MGLPPVTMPISCVRSGLPARTKPQPRRIPGQASRCSGGYTSYAGAPNRRACYPEISSNAESIPAPMRVRSSNTFLSTPWEKSSTCWTRFRDLTRGLFPMQSGHGESTITSTATAMRRSFKPFAISMSGSSVAPYPIHSPSAIPVKSAIFPLT